jgi:hypothetical protein
MPNDFSSFAQRLALLSAVAACSGFACSGVTKQVARDATPVAVDAGIQAGVSDENQEAVVAAIEPERVERATEKLAAGMADGWVNAMTEEERQARVTAALSPVVASLVHESMQTALSDEQLLRVRELAKQATLGFQDAIDEVTEKRDRGTIPADEGNVLEAVDQIAEGGGTAIYVVGALAFVLALLLGAGGMWALGRRRQHGGQVAPSHGALPTPTPYGP